VIEIAFANGFAPTPIPHRRMRAGRTVVSRNQDRINNPDIGDKGLDGKTVMEQALKIYQENTKTDPLLIDTSSRHGRLLRAQMDAIAEVMDSNQKTINQPGVGFKAFIPATFGRLVNEAFAKRVGSEAEMKITAPLDLVRNRKARPDDWETEVIRDKLLRPPSPPPHPPPPPPPSPPPPPPPPPA